MPTVLYSKCEFLWQECVFNVKKKKSNIKSSFFVSSETSNKALVPVFLVYGFIAAFKTYV